MAGLHEQGLSLQQSAAVVDNVIRQQAFTMSATDIFYASAIIFIMLIGLVWIARRPAVSKPSDSGGDAASAAH
jgi:DHA2 family multidrug resistance protein